MPSRADLFDAAWPQGAPLQGFVYFTKARSLFDATVPSMASVFTSRARTPHPPLENALAAPDSIPALLRKAGYRTLAYLPPGVLSAATPRVRRGRLARSEAARPEAVVLHRSLFARLWFATLLPSGIIDRLEGRNAFGFAADDMRSLRHQKMSVLTQPVTSLLSFDRYLEHEALLPASGRYTLIHLLLPHNPVLPYTAPIGDIRAGTDAPHSRAARLMCCWWFLEHLDRLGRLRGSTVLVQSDHGSSVRLLNGALVSTTGDDSALLLIKPRDAISELSARPRP